MISDDMMNQLEKLKSLLDENILTQEEFDEKKAQILKSTEEPAKPVTPTEPPVDKPIIPAEKPTDQLTARNERPLEQTVVPTEEPKAQTVASNENTNSATVKESLPPSPTIPTPLPKQEAGTPLNSNPPLKKSGGKKIIIIVVAIVAALFLLLLIGGLAGGSNNSNTSDNSGYSSEETTNDFEEEEEEEVAPDPVLESISAEYDGSTEKGVTLDEDNYGITVTATYDDGTTETVSGWTVEEPKTLKAGKKSKVTINYDNQSCELTVKCTTVSAEQFKESCKTISYNDLARNPGKHEDKNIKIYGQIIQVVEEDGSNDVTLRVATKDSGYGNYYDDVFLVTYTYDDDESKMLEDDMVTMWGTYGGTYTYESTMGGNITVPLLYAKYAKLGQH